MDFGGFGEVHGGRGHVSVWEVLCSDIGIN